MGERDRRRYGSRRRAYTEVFTACPANPYPRPDSQLGQRVNHYLLECCIFALLISAARMTNAKTRAWLHENPLRQVCRFEFLLSGQSKAAAIVRRSSASGYRVCQHRTWGMRVRRTLCGLRLA